MKPWDKVSSFRGANTLFQGQQNKDTQRRRQITEERSTKEITEEIKGATRDADQRRSKDKSRRTRTAPRHNVRGSEYIANRDCSDD
jgi:hypothetical protein